MSVRCCSGHDGKNGRIDCGDVQHVAQLTEGRQFSSERLARARGLVRPVRSSKYGISRNGIRGCCRRRGAKRQTVVVRRLPEFERQRIGHFRSWLRTITTDCLRDYQKSKRNAVHAAIDDPRSELTWITLITWLMYFWTRSPAHSTPRHSRLFGNWRSMNNQWLRPANGWSCCPTPA